jgi:hypothetical protein
MAEDDDQKSGFTKRERPARTDVQEAVQFRDASSNKAERNQAIGAYAGEMAGTEFDLDQALESAAIEVL